MFLILWCIMPFLVLSGLTSCHDTPSLSAWWLLMAWFIFGTRASATSIMTKASQCVSAVRNQNIQFRSFKRGHHPAAGCHQFHFISLSFSKLSKRESSSTMCILSFCFQIYQDGYHMLHGEPFGMKEQVLAELANWIEARSWTWTSALTRDGI